jgi:hypothetical protein
MLALVPHPHPDPSRAEKLLALLDRAYEIKKAATDLVASLDFFVVTIDAPVVYLMTSHAPEAIYALTLWASPKGFAVQPDPEEPKRHRLITDVGVIASVLDDEDDTHVVDVPLFI